MLISDMRPPLDTAAKVHAAADAGVLWRDAGGRLAAVCVVCSLARPVVALVLHDGRWHCPDELPAAASWALDRPFVLVTDGPATIAAYAAAAPDVPTVVVAGPAARYASLLAGAAAVTVGPDALPGYVGARVDGRPRVYALRVDGSTRPDWAAVVGAGVARVFPLPGAGVMFGRLLGRLARVAAAAPVGQLPARAAAA
jgi:hypothetical protein